MDLPQSVSVRIGPAASASGTYRNTSEKLWSALGFTLPALLTEVWGKQESRMDIDPAVDVRTRYDVVATSVLPEARSDQTERVRRAITEQLPVSVAMEQRLMDIWVLTSPANPAAYSPAYGMQSGSFSFNGEFLDSADVPQTPEALEEWFRSGIRRVPAIGMAFSPTLGLPFSRGALMFGEPEEDGSCQIQMEWTGGGTEERLVQALCDDLGIAASKERRSVEMLVVRPR